MAVLDRKPLAGYWIIGWNDSRRVTPLTKLRKEPQIAEVWPTMLANPRVCNIGGEELWWRAMSCPSGAGVGKERLGYFMCICWSTLPFVHGKPTLWDTLRMQSQVWRLLLVAQRTKKPWPASSPHFRQCGGFVSVLALARDFALSRSTQ